MSGPRRLGPQRSPEVGTGLTLLVPLGATEQHGPHLPLDTDTRIAVAVAEAAAAAGGPGVVVAPAVPYGSSGEHAGFAGTLSIGQDALELLLVELVRACGPEVARVVFVNGHGGNAEPLARALARLASEGRNATAWSVTVPGGDAHAGVTETSLLLHLAPEVVGPERFAGNTAPLRELLGELRRDGVRAVSPNGVLGDPAGASAERGRALLADLVGRLGSVLRNGTNVSAVTTPPKEDSA